MSLLFRISFLVISFIAYSCSVEASGTSEAPSTRYTKDLAIYSKVLNTRVKYSVYLPENYSNESSRYGVVYLLHGYGSDDNNSWNDNYIRVSAVIDELEEMGGVTPMIYVMPQGFGTYYVNRHNGTYNYMDMFVKELVPHIDKTLQTIPNRSHRAIAGYSMGGYGALIIASRHKDVFSVSAPLSMSFRTDKQYITEPSSGWDRQWGLNFGAEGEIGESRLTDYYKEHNPLYYFTESTASSFSDIKFFFHCGDDEEQLLILNDTLHVILRNLHIDHEYRVRNGAHTSSYWNEAIKEVIPFIDDCFKGEEYQVEEEITVNVKELIAQRYQIRDCQMQVYYPSKFDAQKKYPTIYYLYEDIDHDTFLKSITLLNKIQFSNECVIVACNSSEMVKNGVSFNELLDESNKYFMSTDCRIGIGYLAGGEILYNASVTDSPIGSVFLIEAALDENISSPNREVSYYFIYSDKSNYYQGANALYLNCKRLGCSYEYRVINGEQTSNSLLVCLNEMISSIIK